MHSLHTYPLAFDANDSKCLLRLLSCGQNSLLVGKFLSTGLDNAAHLGTPGQAGHHGLGGKVTIVNFANCGDVRAQNVKGEALRYIHEGFGLM